MLFWNTWSEKHSMNEQVPSQRSIAIDWPSSCTTLNADNRTLVNMFLTFAFCPHVYLERAFAILLI